MLSYGTILNCSIAKVKVNANLAEKQASKQDLSRVRVESQPLSQNLIFFIWEYDKTLIKPEIPGGTAV